MKESALKPCPCPFCGSDHILVYESAPNEWTIRCGGECKTYHGQEWVTKREAINAWNSRPTPPTPPREPTEEMLGAAAIKILPSYAGQVDHQFCYDIASKADLVTIWKAMYDAAPQPEGASEKAGKV